MKKIILLILISVSVISAQTYVVKDTTNTAMNAVRAYATRLTNIDARLTDITTLQTQITLLNNLIEVQSGRINALEDTIVIFRSELNGLQSGGNSGVPEPTAPTSVVATATGTTSGGITWVKPTSVNDSIYIYRDDVKIAVVDSGVTTYNNTGLTSATIYTYKLRSIKRVGGLLLLSDYSNSDTMLTNSPAPETPSSGEPDYYVSLWGGGDTLTLQEAKSIEGTLLSGSDYADTFFVANGRYTQYDIVGSGIALTVTYSASGESGRNILYKSISANKEKDTNFPSGDSSVTIVCTISDNPKYSITGSYRTWKGINFGLEYTSANSLLSITGNYVTLDSCGVFHNTNNASSSSNHTMTVSGHHYSERYVTHTRGSRTSIWLRKGSSTNADNATFDNCRWTGCSNHPPIQIMPTTNWNDTTTIKHVIIKNSLFENNSYSDGIYSRNNEQCAYFNNVFYMSSTPYSIDMHTGLHYPTGAATDTCNGKGNLFVYNTIIESGGNIIYNNGTNQNYFKNNLIYLTSAPSGTQYNYPSTFNPIYRHQNDYNVWWSTSGSMANLYYTIGSLGSGTLNSIYSSRGFEQHSQIQVSAPTFTDYNNGDFTPLNVSSPQKGKGTPITTANGYWMNITTDKNGNARSNTTPTAGAFE